MNLLISLIVGAIIGSVAGKIMGKEKQGCLINIILGLLGAFVGGLIANFLHINGGMIVNLILSVIGACIVIFVVGKIQKS